MVLMQGDAEDLNSVRVNIPLSRVNSVEKTNIVSFAGLIIVTFDPKSSNGASHDPLAEQPTSDTDDKEVMSLLETAPEKQVLQFGVMRSNLEWINVMSYVDKAKTSVSSDNVDWPGSRVYIDVDPRTNESPRISDNNLSDLVKSISFALGLDATKEIWSMSRAFIPPHCRLTFVSFSSQSPSSSPPRMLFRSHRSEHGMRWILVEICYRHGHSLPRPSVSYQCREAT